MGGGLMRVLSRLAANLIILYSTTLPPFTRPPHHPFFLKTLPRQSIQPRDRNYGYSSTFQNAASR